MFFVFRGCIFGICYSVGLYAGAVFVDKGYITQSDLFGSYFAFMLGGVGLGQLGSVASDIKDGQIAANKFLQIWDRKPKIKQPDYDVFIANNTSKKTTIPNGTIEFKNVSFAYPTAPEINVINNISVTIESGKTLAIVGPSGSGKSTILSLLERYYDIDPKSGDGDGEIRIGGRLIHNYDISYLRSHIGLVSQMPLLFNSTIRENICAGDDETTVTEWEIVRAAKLANAHDFIMKLPNQYETQVGELGARLSGGQRQRICIARAILKNPTVLLLDEATASLDSKSEKEVQDALDHITRQLNLTTIIIAHRLSSVKDADKIIVLVDGAVKEMGNHSELLMQNGVYATLVESQQLIDVSKKQRRQSRASVSE